MKIGRLIELAITVASCVVFSNWIAVSFGDTRDQLNALAQNKSLIEVLAGAWLLALIMAPKQLPRIG